MTIRPVAATLLLAISLCSQRQITSPEQAFGKKVGADYFLANYTQLREYWRKVAAESDCMELETIGKTSYGQPMLLAVISSPENLARREEFRGIATRLCRARGLTDDDARKLARQGRAVVWIDAGMHATESVAAQNIIELVYRMNAQTDEETRNILDNVILLVCPANPDGMELVANAYMATRKVGGLPILYQKYVGHDNNRDYYACNQRETIQISHALYTHWNPQILYNHHQTAPRGTIIFTPPFRDPFNYNFDPLVVRGIEIVAAHMTHRFAQENKPGVISRTGASYSTWWNGGLRTTAYFHNVIGILTETFGSPNPSRVTQTRKRRLPYGDYPQPITSQPWHARQTIEYLQTANRAILDYAARYRFEMLWNIYQMGRNAIARGSKDHWTLTPRFLDEAKRLDSDDVFTAPERRDPRGYILPSDQSDFAAATRFVAQLMASGIEVHRATRDFEVGFASYPRDSWIVRCDQAFRSHVLDMFEPQWHPDDLGNGGEPVRPYDSAGWTLAMQMGVRFDRILDAFDGPFERVTRAKRPAASASAGQAGWLLSHFDSDSFRATNRLLAAGDRVYWLRRRSKLGARSWPAGSVFVRRGRGTDQRVAELAKELGIRFEGIDRVPAGNVLSLERPRIGVFDVWGGNMPTGWARWALEQFDFPYELVFGKRLIEGNLSDDYDVLLFHTGLPSFSVRPRNRRPSRKPNKETIAKLQKALPKFQDWSNIADRLVTLTKDNCKKPLADFVERGGTLLGFGSQARSLARMLDLPVRTGTWTSGDDGKRRPTNRSEFFIPGSLVRIEVDNESTVGFGVAKQSIAMFRRSPVFEIEQGAPDSVRAPVRYAESDILASGWAIGEGFLANRAAVVEARVGRGRVYMFGADAMYRGQPWGTFKLVFNALLASKASSTNLR